MFYGQDWGERQVGHHKDGPDTSRYPLCPDCTHHDAHMFCRECLLWFCYAHFRIHHGCAHVLLEVARFTSGKGDN